jgi:hypothetical protein
MLADDLLEDARHLAAKGDAEKRASCMRRAVSTAYYAVFHLLVEDFVANWPYADQRARLARMFDHKKMRDAAFTPKDEKNPTPIEGRTRRRKNSISPASGGKTPGRLRSGVEYRSNRCQECYQFGGRHVHQMAVN